MSPRKYHSALRKELTEETRRRIIDATIALHAELGSMATNHSRIAKRAKVSTPTVYKYFPTREDLFPACIGKVEGKAPPLDRKAILSEKDPGRRIMKMIEAVYRRHAFFSPWLSWAVAEAQVIPELAKALYEGNQQLDRLAREVLSLGSDRRHFSEAYAVTRIFLDFTTWQRLDRTLQDPEQVIRTAVMALRSYLTALSKKGGLS